MNRIIYQICIVTNRAKNIKETLPRFTALVRNDIKLFVMFMTKGDKKIDIKGNISFATMSDLGVTRGLNEALEKMMGDIIIFADDDCFPSRNWIHSIREFTKKNKRYDLFFGQTKPYQPRQNLNKYCPCTFEKTSTKDPQLGDAHWIEVGFNNNMAVKKKIFKDIGYFKTWLGPGSISKGGEDAEFILRCMIAGYKIGYEKKMILFHNKWLSHEEEKRQTRMYISGGIAAYGFYVFQGVEEIQKLFWTHIKWSEENILSAFRSLIHSSPQQLATHFIELLKEMKVLVLAILIAFFYAKIVPIPEKEDVVKRFYHKPHNLSL